jgi:hypothetical protein
MRLVGILSEQTQSSHIEIDSEVLRFGFRKGFDEGTFRFMTCSSRNFDG